MDGVMHYRGCKEEEKEKEKKDTFHTLWLQVFDRENFREKPTFCIIKIFLNKFLLTCVVFVTLF